MEDIQQKPADERNIDDSDGPAAGAGARTTPRQQAILARVQHHGFVTIEALAVELGVSGQTIRREIIRLEDLGTIRRFHGGAGLPDAPVRRSYAEKTQIGRDGKGRIARRAVQEIAPGMAVFLDVGTTADAVAQALAAIIPLRVFTNNLRAAMILAEADGVATFVTGGSVGGSDGSLTGDVTLRALGLVKCDIAVIGFSGLDPDGSIMDFDHDKIAAKRAMMRHARRVLLVGQADKFGRPAVVRLGRIEEVSTIITDARPPAWAEELAQQRQVPIIVA
jgi:DeoR family glycerol-3-phosphate regulon repressor